MLRICNSSVQLILPQKGKGKKKISTPLSVASKARKWPYPSLSLHQQSSIARQGSHWRRGEKHLASQARPLSPMSPSQARRSIPLASCPLLLQIFLVLSVCLLMSRALLRDYLYTLHMGLRRKEGQRGGNKRKALEFKVGLILIRSWWSWTWVISYLFDFYVVCREFESWLAMWVRNRQFGWLLGRILVQGLWNFAAFELVWRFGWISERHGVAKVYLILTNKKS